LIRGDEDVVLAVDGRPECVDDARHPFLAERDRVATTGHYEDCEDIQHEIPDARVWMGFHFRNSVEQGEKLANHVAHWALDHYFKPTRS